MLIRVLFLMAAFLTIPFLIFGSMYSPEIMGAVDPLFCPDTAMALTSDPETRLGLRGTSLVAHYYCEHVETGESYEVTAGFTIVSILQAFVLAYLVLRFPGIPKRRDPSLPEIVMP